jgi:hypothetical protein
VSGNKSESRLVEARNKFMCDRFHSTTLATFDNKRYLFASPHKSNSYKRSVQFRRNNLYFAHFSNVHMAYEHAIVV